MTNNQIADISVLEQLQNQANLSFDSSSRSVFNSKEELISLAKKEDALILKYNNEKAKLDQIPKNAPGYQRQLQIVKQIEEQGIYIAQKRLTMYKNDIAKVRAEETDAKIIRTKETELFKASSTSQYSPFEDKVKKTIK
jgi:hypothetical protein